LFNGSFSGQPWANQYQNVSVLDLFELLMMEVVVTTGAVRRAKLQSNCHHQQTNTQLFTGQMPFLSPNDLLAVQQCQSTEGKSITFHGLAYAKLI